MIELNDKDYWNHFFRKGKQPIFPSEVLIRFLKINYNNPANVRVLDLGCGNGRNSFAAQSLGLDVWMVDYSDEALNRLTARGISPERLHKLDISMDTFPFANGFFDCVFSLLVLYHIRKKELQMVLNKVTQVLKPGGFMVCNFLPEEHWLNVPDRKDSYLQNEAWISHSHDTSIKSKILCEFYTREELESIFSGYAKVKIIKEEIPISLSMLDDKEKTYPVLWVFAQF